ncbi:unnamed protein product [Mucor fragilis]
MVKHVENLAPRIPFNGVNVAELFQKFQQTVQRLSSERLLFILSYVHKLLALSNTLPLCPNQYSPLCIDIFTPDVLSSLNKELLLDKCIEFNQGVNDDALCLGRFLV